MFELISLGFNPAVYHKAENPEKCSTKYPAFCTIKCAPESCDGLIGPAEIALCR